MSTMTYEVTGRIARITLDRPERGNGITLEMPRELAACVERADLDPNVHVIALSGRGKGFCGGYDLVQSAEDIVEREGFGDGAQVGTPLASAVIARNHDPRETWDPVVDYQMMARNVKGFMSLFHADKPVVCKVHGFCVAGARTWRCARICW
jgi:enoyl-CoA hydratase